MPILPLEDSMPSPSFELKTQVVRAGAGTGKTTSLIQTFFDTCSSFQKHKGRLPRIVISTFTRKATQEVRERLLVAALDRGEYELFSFIQNTEQVFISTLHGVLSLFLRKYGSPLGLPPSWSLLDSEELEHAQHLTLSQVFSDPEASTSLDTLAEHFDPKQIRSLILRFSLGLQEYPDLSTPSKEMELAFRSEQADQLKKAAEAYSNFLQGLELSAEWREFIERLNFGIRSAQDTEYYLQLPKLRKPRGMPTEFDQIRFEYEESLDGLTSWQSSDEFFDIHQKLGAALQDLTQIYLRKLSEQRKQTAGISMEEIELLSLDLVRHHPILAEQFGSNWDYWMLDEYQDTSPRQVMLLDKLIGNLPQYVVGDPQQSIYLFRGAQRGVFQAKESTVPSSQLHLLQTNYRSHPKLLNFLNSFFQKLGPFQPMLPGRQDTPTTRAIATYIKMPPSENPKEKILAAQSLEWEAKVAIERLQQLMDQGSKSVVILARKNDELLAIEKASKQRDLPLAVVKNTLSYRHERLELLSILRFLLQPHDNVNLMRVLTGPWFRCITNHFEGLARSGKSLWGQLNQMTSPLVPAPEKFQALADLKSLLAYAQDVGAVEAWRFFLVLNQVFSQSQKVDPTGLLEKALWNLLEIAKAKQKEGPESLLRWVRYALEDLSHPRGATMDSEIPDILPQQNFQAMTIHASKGLQFDDVILVGCGSWRPSNVSGDLLIETSGSYFFLGLPEPESGKKTWSWLAKKELSEKKQHEYLEYDRLCYVALTRAKESVTLVYGRKDPGSWASRMWIQDQEIVETSVLEKQPTATPPSEPGRLRPVASLQDCFPKSSLAPTKLKLDRIRSQIQGQRNHLDFQLRGPGFQALLNELRQQNEDVLVKALPQAHVEWGFQIRTTDHSSKPAQDIAVGHAATHAAGHAMVNTSGQIDAWVVTDEGELLIIDYKTGKSTDLKKAWLQLSGYLNALHFIYPYLKDLPWQLVVLETSPVKIHKRNNQNFSGQILFADGAAKGNPGPAGWGLIFMNSQYEIVEKNGSSELATNNQMELQGVIEGLRLANNKEPCSIYTDSSYVIKGITQWIFGWKKRNWLTAEGQPVANQEYWQKLDSIVRHWSPGQLSWHYVRGHNGNPGNERVDALAQAAATGQYIPFYRGSLHGYDVDIFDVPEDTSVPESSSQKQGASSKAPAFSYISYLDGKAIRHKTWKSCEARVKGRSGAKFKKAQTSQAELEIFQDWKISPDSVTEES